MLLLPAEMALRKDRHTGFRFARRLQRTAVRLVCITRLDNDVCLTRGCGSPTRALLPGSAYGRRRVHGDLASYYGTSDSAYNFGYELRLEGEGAGIGAAQSCSQTHSR